MLNWNSIDTVLLDLDGTLLDLHFDNHFWLEHLPKIYAEKNQLTLDEAFSACKAMIDGAQGTLNWYCLDYWDEKLGLDTLALKASLAHLIRVHDSTNAFLTKLQEMPCKVYLVTNSHPRGLELKLKTLDIANQFDAIHSSHDYAVPKEDLDFWAKLNHALPFDPNKTLFIDDNHEVLKTAQTFGIAHCYGIKRPDTQKPEVKSDDFVLLGSLLDVFR